MKIFFTIIIFSISIFAQPSQKEIMTQVQKVVQNYADAISCESQPIDQKLIVPFVPYKRESERLDAMYGAIWLGDIGCTGGRGGLKGHIAVLTIGAGDAVLVDPSQSSPIVEFPLPTTDISKVVSHAKDSIVLEGKTFAPNDPACCPSKKVIFTLKRNRDGSWALVGQK